MVIPKDLVITAKPSPSLISIFGIQDLNYENQDGRTLMSQAKSGREAGVEGDRTDRKRAGGLAGLQDRVAF